MALAETPFIGKVREELLDRRALLEDVLSRNESEQMQHLLQEVDHALERMNVGKFGLCEVCHDTIEEGRLLNDSTISVCLGCLSPAQQRSLEHDLELAAQIQRGLLPPQNVEIAGWDIAYHYRPAGVVSGDYCDLIGSGDGGLHFLIADVSGKGIAAALLSTNLRAVFRALIPLGLSMEKMLAQASRLFCDSTLPTQYATLVAGRVSASGELEIVNAGHLPVLLTGESGTRVFESTDLPFGMFCDQQFTASKALLQPGDTLVLYTDGISEAQNHAGEECGVTTIRSLIEDRGLRRPDVLVRACREHIDGWRDGQERADDETLLAIRYQPARVGAGISPVLVNGNGTA
ncbi:MAG TPA: SpoIIE family protein phosphatase [Terriglobales bacterium]